MCIAIRPLLPSIMLRFMIDTHVETAVLSSPLDSSPLHSTPLHSTPLHSSPIRVPIQHRARVTDWRPYWIGLFIARRVRRPFEVWPRVESDCVLVFFEVIHDRPDHGVCEMVPGLVLAKTFKISESEGGTVEREQISRKKVLAKLK